MAKPSQRVTGNILGLVCMIVWATNFPVAEKVLASWHPVLLTPIRLAAATLMLCLATIAFGMGRQLLALPAGFVLLAGGGGLAISNLFFVWGQAHIDPVAAAITVSAMPLMSAVFGFVTRTERMTVNLAIGIVLAVVGGAIAGIGISGDGEAASEGSVLGVVVMLAAVAIYVGYMRMMIGRYPEISELPKVAVSSGIAALVTLLFAEVCLIFGVVEAQMDFSLPTLAQILWLGGISMGTASALFLMAGRMIGVTVAAMHHNMVPFYVMVMALFVGGAVSPQTVAGAVLVITGGVVAQMPPLQLRPRRGRV